MCLRAAPNPEVFDNLIVSFNSSHFDKLEHTYKFTKEILKAKNNLVYSTHFDSSERIQTFFQKFKKWKSSSIMRHNF